METILRTLTELAQAEGVQIWLVGGFVRDILLDRRPLDADLVLQEAVPFARRVARAVRGAFVLLDDEWGTARVVIKRGQSKPVELDFAELRGATLAEDLASRDFTINAMAGSLPEFLEGPEQAVWDPFHGRMDLQRGLIRAVTPASLQADPLRVVRAYRLAAQLEFTLDPSTQALANAAAPKLAAVSVERITAELFKLLSAPHSAAYFRELAEHRLLAAVLPAAPWKDLAAATDALAHLERWLAEPAVSLQDAAERVMRWVETASHPPLLKWATLWDGLLEAPARAAVASRLKLSRDQQRLWQTLASSREAPRVALEEAIVGPPGPPNRALLCQHFHQTGAAGIGSLLIQWAHLQAHWTGAEAGDRLAAAARAALRLFERELEPILSRPRLLTGGELQQEFHMRPGPRFKELLASLLEAELMGQITTPEEARQFIRQRLKQDCPESARML